MNELRQIRLDLGLSRSEWAKLLDVTPPTIGSWERGDHRPSPLSRDRIFRVLKKLARRIRQIERGRADGNNL